MRHEKLKKEDGLIINWFTTFVTRMTWFNKFLLKFHPKLAIPIYLKKMGVENPVFDKVHEAFFKTERIDFFPSVAGRGFVLVVDRRTALFFYQKGYHFVYDGYEMGKYNKGDVRVLDDIEKRLSIYP